MNNANEFSELARGLASLAMQWRSAHVDHNFEQANKTVIRYHELMKQLWDLGWRGDDLLPDEELPNELMPRYFLSYWRRRPYRQD